MKICIKRLKNVPMPGYATSGSAGMDLCAAIEAPIVIHPHQRALVPTGVAVAVPDGYELQLRPRSGLAVKSGLTLLNSPGTIDSDYRGEIVAIVINHSDESFTIDPQMRICQMIVSPCPKIEWIEVDDLDNTIRGEGGFGSSGL